MAAREQPITGFEGVTDSLMYDTLRQAQFQQRVLEQRQIANPYDRAIDAFGNLLTLGVNELAPPLAEKNARAVTQARANAIRTIEGQQFESPYLRQVALVEAAADELEQQGLGSSAEQLRANALQLRTQALEFKKLGGEVRQQDLTVDRLEAEKPYWAANFRNASRLTETQAAASEQKLAEDIAGMDDRLATLRAERESAQGEAASVGLKRDKLIAEIEASRASASLARFNLAARVNGDPVTVTLPGQGVFDAMRQIDGSIIYQDSSGQTRRVPAGLYASASLQGGQESVASPNSPVGKALSQQAEFGNLLDLAGQVKQNTFVNPGTRTLSGQGAALLDQLRAQATMVRGGQSAQQRATDDAALNDVFRQYNISDATQQSLITSLAYGIARVREPSAPALSRADIEGAAASIGGSNPSDAALRAVIDTNVNTLYRSMERASIAAGRPVSPELKAMMERYRAIGAQPAPTGPQPGMGGRSAPRVGPPPAGARQGSSIRAVTPR